MFQTEQEIHFITDMKKVSLKGEIGRGIDSKKMSQSIIHSLTVKSNQKGNFGVVFKGTYQGKDVAVKKIHSQTPEKLEEFNKEVQIMM